MVKSKSRTRRINRPVDGLVPGWRHYGKAVCAPPPPPTALQDASAVGNVSGNARPHPDLLPQEKEQRSRASGNSEGYSLLAADMLEPRLKQGATPLGSIVNSCRTVGWRPRLFVFGLFEAIPGKRNEAGMAPGLVCILISPDWLSSPCRPCHRGRGRPELSFPSLGSR
jgi:hypothetical protein